MNALNPFSLIGGKCRNRKDKSLENTACLQKTRSCRGIECVCENGVPAASPTCQNDADNTCQSCNDGYFLNLDTLTCVLKICECVHGTPTNGTECTNNGDFICSECEEGATFSRFDSIGQPDSNGDIVQCCHADTADSFSTVGSGYCNKNECSEINAPGFCHGPDGFTDAFLVRHFQGWLDITGTRYYQVISGKLIRFCHKSDLGSSSSQIRSILFV